MLQRQQRDVKKQWDSQCHHALRCLELVARRQKSLKVGQAHPWLLVQKMRALAAVCLLSSHPASSLLALRFTGRC